MINKYNCPDFNKVVKYKKKIPLMLLEAALCFTFLGLMLYTPKL